MQNGSFTIHLWTIVCMSERESAVKNSGEFLNSHKSISNHVLIALGRTV